MSHDSCLAHSTALPTGASGASLNAARACGFHRIALGDLWITAVFDGSTRLPFDELMTGAAPGEIERTLVASGTPSPVDTPVNTYLIDTGTHRILIDAGAGSNFGTDCGKLLGNLQAAGYSPDDIDVVLLTHMHPDHVGGLVCDGKTVFANADLLINRADLDYWFDAELEAQAPEERQKIFRQTKTGVAPYLERKKVRAFEAGDEVLPGIIAIPAPGHTAGHTLLRVVSAGDVIVFFGDQQHSAAVQMSNPAIAIKLDSDQREAIASRKAWFARFARENTLVAGAHMTFPGVGHVGLKGTGFEWLPS